MNFVIPMAGRGQRFTDAGYRVPKMLIEAKGKTLLEWSIDSLPLELCTNMVCIMLRQHDTDHQLTKRIKEIYGSRVPLSFYYLDQVTRGQAETVLLAQDLFLREKDLVVFNIDTCFRSDTLAERLKRQDHDGVLGAFHSIESRFSFAAVDENDVVTKTAEKQVISDHALTGLYHFRKVSDFMETVNYHIDNDIRVNNEFYIAPMYNYLIDRGRRFVIDKVAEHHILGTPEELNTFLKRTDL
jgi:dTDP-glucose pyrophosphorylase